MSKLLQHITQTKTEREEVRGTSSNTSAKGAFYKMCIHYVIQGYKRAITFGILTLVDEEDISDLLVTHTEFCLEEDGISVDVDAERRDRTIPVDGKSVRAKKRRRFDFVFKSFERPTMREMFTAEAKILKLNDKDLMKKYISEKGMRKYINQVYKKPGFMIGYVKEGVVNEIIVKLNEVITVDSTYKATEKLFLQNPIGSYLHFYKSEHENINLDHLMLNFVT